MALQGSWIRGKPSKGLRQINIRYEVDDATFKDIEDLLERVPYKKVNEVMRHALLVGSKIMLSTSNNGEVSVPTQPSTNEKKTAAPPAYSAAAAGMFETFGGDGKK